MKIYLAGPMRGIPLFNFPAFEAATKRLRALGHEVFNPAESDVEKDGFNPATDAAKSMSYYMERDLPAVCAAEAIALLPGWEKSEGVSIELWVAQRLSKKILDAETLQPIPPKSILEEALEIAGQSRQRDYGHPLINHERIAAMWNVQLGPKLTTPIGPREVALMMIALKLAREVNAMKRDNIVDIVGYAHCIDLMAVK